jgi:hypothetical protein
MYSKEKRAHYVFELEGRRKAKIGRRISLILEPLKVDKILGPSRYLCLDPLFANKPL